MPCYHPIRAWRNKKPGFSGKHGIVFGALSAYTDLTKPLQIPCGQCIGCRLEKSRQWAIRCLHEASLYQDNCFITLTYDPKNLPTDGSLNKKHFQDFMKRLRKKYEPRKIRFFHCGEYGDEGGRPHYHACIFNFDFPDKKLWKEREEIKLYISDSLFQLWPYGYSTIGEVTFESAAYIARYVTKKITGKQAIKHYEKINTETGEISSIQPEYATMSRRPGIGAPWLAKWRSDIYPSDFIIINGQKVKPPKYYDDLETIQNSEFMEQLKEIRIQQFIKNNPFSEGSTKRLLVKETVKKAQFAQLPRKLENEI